MMDTFATSGPMLQAAIILLAGWSVIVMMGFVITLLRGVSGWLLDLVRPKATVVSIADYRRKQLNAVVRAGDRRRVS